MAHGMARKVAEHEAQVLLNIKNGEESAKVEELAWFASGISEKTFLFVSIARSRGRGRFGPGFGSGLLVEDATHDAD